VPARIAYAFLGLLLITVLGTSPAGRYFTIALIAGGAGTGLYLLSVLAESVLEGRLRDVYRRGAMLRRIEHLEGHAIVCGYGRFGQIVARELEQGGTSIVVIECNPALEPELAASGFPYVVGSATADEVLVQAGIQRASALVVAVSSESDCVFVTLAARELNPGIQIHARCETDAATRRVKRAGANAVISPLRIGGSRAAMSILRPTVVDFLELSSPGRGEEIDLEEIRVEPGAPLEGMPVRDLESAHSRVRVVAIKRGKDAIRIIPSRDDKIAALDHLVVIGSRDELADMALAAQSPTR
jgi:voltage-gated potassium channel